MNKQFLLERRNVPESQHAKARRQQRCIPKAIRDLVLDFGVSVAAGGGTERYTFDRKGWRYVETYLGPQAKHFSKYRNVFVLFSADGLIVTEGWVH